MVQAGGSSTLAFPPVALAVNGPSGESVATVAYEGDLRFNHDGRVVTALATIERTHRRGLDHRCQRQRPGGSSGVGRRCRRPRPDRRSGQCYRPLRRIAPRPADGADCGCDQASDDRPDRDPRVDPGHDQCPRPPEILRSLPAERGSGRTPTAATPGTAAIGAALVCVWPQQPRQVNTWSPSANGPSGVPPRIPCGRIRAWVRAVAVPDAVSRRPAHSRNGRHVPSPVRTMRFPWPNKHQQRSPCKRSELCGASARARVGKDLRPFPETVCADQA